MAPKGGTCFVLLTVACAALAMPPHGMPENKRDFKDMAKKLMRKCVHRGYPAPEMLQLKTIFNNSYFPMEDRNAEQSNTALSTFLKVLRSVSPDGANKDPQVDKMTNKMWNFSNLPTMIKLMRNSSEASACYMQAFVAPLCWATLTKQTTESENNMASEDYDALLWAAKPALQDRPFKRMNLPTGAGKRKYPKRMMNMLKEVYGDMSKGQKAQVVKWAKEQIVRKYSNCTMRPPSDSRSMLMTPCKPSLKWLSSEALTMMGPYISSLAPNDIDFSPKEQLCNFFRSAQFKSATSMTTKLNPSLGKKFLQKFQECFSGKEEFAENVDKLGVLACHYSVTPDLTPDLSRNLLSELDDYNDCGDPRITRLKKRLVKSAMSNTNGIEALRKLGRSFALLSPKQLSEIPVEDLKELVKNLGPTVQWTRGQPRTLVKRFLRNKCENVSGEELMALQSVAEGLPSCVLKHVKKILNNTECLENMSKRMRKGQLMTMLQGLLGDVAPSELRQKLPSRLLRSLPLNKLETVYPSLDRVEDKMWNLQQAAFLAKKMHDLKKLHWRLRSVLQGVICKMIDNVADSDVQDMAQAITETPQWLSKMQAGCAARKLFATKEKERADYFKTITEEEMTNIPTSLLLHLPPSKVKDLPDSVCPFVLDEMEEADLSLLPRRSPSRAALTQRAMLCLAEVHTMGTDLSGPTDVDMFRLGPLLCELPPSQLLLMAPDVLISSLQAMASCQHIPQSHRADIIQLVKKTFGDPFDWSAENMEALGPLLLMDDDATSALPNKPWMKDVLYFLKSGHTSDALREKCFYLSTNTSNASLKTRTANSNVSDSEILTEEFIEDLGMDNVYLTAAQLGQMSNETFLATLETLGAVSGYNDDQLAKLKEKATETLGPVSSMTESEVMQMGCITRGFSNADLQRLPFLLDDLEEIAHCGWIESQMESMWKGVAKYNNLNAQQLGAAEMVALNQFICGLNSIEIGQLNMDAFKDAVGSLGGVTCSYMVTQQLKTLAVSAFGNPNTWTEAQVSELGNIIAGLDSTELASLPSSVFSFINKSSIPLIPHLAALSTAQLEAFGADNAEMVTSQQRAALTDEQLSALDRAETGSPDLTQRSDPSGAPSLSVEGISAFMKPLLFLLMGFLLL